jgi:signal transduction histidine kinase
VLAASRLRLFLPLAAARVAWLLLLLAITWWQAGTGAVPLLAGAVVVLVVQLLWVLLALVDRLPRWHDLAAAGATLVVVPIALWFFPERVLLLLLLFMVPILDLAQARGWLALAALPLVGLPLLAFSLLFAAYPAPALTEVATWGLVTVLGVALVVLARRSGEIVAGSRQAPAVDEDAMRWDAEQVRHQLARDLHDGPLQRVAAVSMQLEFIKLLLRRNQPERAMEELERVEQITKHVSQEMRTVLFTLRPVVLESEGLAAALDTFVKRILEQEGGTITLEADPVPRLDPRVEEVTFAILQEAIRNAMKHANGAPIRVRLIKAQSMLVGQVEDEGPGFDLQAISSSYGTRGSLGLINMQERARMLGGQLKIDSALGKGTLVSLVVPDRAA